MGWDRTVKPLPRPALYLLFGLVVALPVKASAPPLPAVVTLADGTYSVTREARNAFDRDVGKLMEAAKEAAAAFCAEKGKQPKVVSVTIDKPWITTGFVKATVVFKALDAGDPLLADHTPVPVIHARKKTVTAAATVSVPAPAPVSPVNDLYNDLLKLDDLHKRGILTDEEFQEEKKKVLNRSK